jgi:predicted hydrocarbon binding protein
MPRVTLYVPDDLKTRMDEAGEAINWSAVAQRAFMEAVLTRAVRKDASDMTSVVERLRASKERVEAAQQESGQDCGKTWAKETAEYDELERIARFHESGHDPSDLVAALRHLIDPEDEMSPHEWHSFWEQHGCGEPTHAFAEGFIKGAVEVYDEVADQL